MRSRQAILIIAAVLTAASVNALAQTAQATDGYYVGAHAGKLLLTFRAEPVLNEDLYAAGLTVGKELSVIRESILAVEMDLTLPTGDGTTRLYGTWSHWSTGLYAVLRMGRGDLYVKARLGLLYEEIDIDAPGGYEASDLGISPGVGLGVRMTPRAAVELEGTMLDERVGVLRGGVWVGF